MLGLWLYLATVAPGVASAIYPPSGSPVHLQLVNRFEDNPDWKIEHENNAARSRFWQYSPIGIVQRVRELRKDPQSPGRATAFYVGPCLVLTNYHVVYGDTIILSSHIDYDLKISMGLAKDQAAADESVIHPVMHGDMTDNGEWDYALLDDPKCLGTKYGWYNLDRSISSSELIENKYLVFVIAYSADRPFGQLDASVGYVTGKRQRTGNIQFSASEAPGASGAPIFTFKDGSLIVVGLNVGGPKEGDNYMFKHYTDQRANEFFNTRNITELWNQWERYGRNPHESPLDNAPLAVKRAYPANR